MLREPTGGSRAERLASGTAKCHDSPPGSRGGPPAGCYFFAQSEVSGLSSGWMSCEME